ncbi:MAG: pentapeptide repeat-containing protein [Clostridium sp.]|nr:pentapeptide repeat-containing protein [Clostridium sp.]
MNRDELLQELKSTVIGDKCQSAKQDLYALLRERKRAFGQKLVEQFEKLCELYGEQDLEEYAYVSISFLRTGILNGTYDWYMVLLDKDGSLDRHDRSIAFSMKEFFTPLDSLDESLKKLMEPYVFILNDCDVEKIKLEAFQFFVPCLYMMGCYAFRNIMENESYCRLPKAKLFRILFGEYNDKCQIVHMKNGLHEKNEGFMERLYSKTEENGFTSPEFQFIDLRNFEFIDECIAYKGFLYGNFSGARFVNQQILSCNFIGANFHKTLIKDSNFYFNVCHDADFSHSVLELTTIAYCHFEDGTIEEEHVTPGLGAVNFDGAVIRNVEFANCFLSGCHFELATLENVNFNESVMNGCVFRKEDLDTIVLSEEQRKQIILV